MIAIKRGIGNLLLCLFASAATLLCFGCSDAARPERSDALGSISMSLRDPTGAYQLSGSITLARQQLPGYSRTEILDVTRQSKSFSLPVGTYAADLVQGWTLSRKSGGDTVDVTQLVTSFTIDPAPISIQAGGTTLVTITFTLAEGAVVALNAGQVQVVLAADDEGLLCGGCAEGRICLQRSGRYRCANTCVPRADNGCGAGDECRLVYLESGDGGLRPLNVCVSTPVEVEDQSAVDRTNLGASINEAYRFVAQGYTAGIDGTLVRVAVDIGGLGDARLRVAIRRAPDGIPEPTSISEVVLSTAGSPLDQLITLATPVEQIAGERFAIVVDYPMAPPPGPGEAQGEWYGTNGVYPAGASLSSEDGVHWEPQSGAMLHFRTIVATTP